MLKKYSLMLILSGSTNEEATEAILAQVRQEIEKLQGSVRSEEMLGKRMFARPMKKRESGRYVKLAIDLPPENVALLHGRFKLNEDVFRAQILTEIKRREKKVRATEPEPVDVAKEADEPKKVEVTDGVAK